MLADSFERDLARRRYYCFAEYSKSQVPSRVVEATMSSPVAGLSLEYHALTSPTPLHVEEVTRASKVTVVGASHKAAAQIGS